MRSGLGSGLGLVSQLVGMVRELSNLCMGYKSPQKDEIIKPCV